MMEKDDLDDLSDEEIEAELLDRPISSLRDVQYTYGALYELSFGEVDEYFPFLTPTEFADNLDEPESLVAVDVDLAEREVVGATVTEYTEEMIPKAAHSRSDGARDMDHSITHQSAASPSPEKLGTYAKKRLTRWPADDLIQQFREEEAGDDGWIIDALEEVGEDDEQSEVAAEVVAEAVSDDNTPALVTVRVKTDLDAEWRWPGEVDVLQDAMRYRWVEKQSRKSVKDSNPASRGEGAPGQIIGDDAESLVGTASAPLNYFRAKQREKFEDLSRVDAWLSHPISERATARIQNAGEFIDACFHNTFGLRAYHLPYVAGEMDAADARALYKLLVNLANDDEMNALVRAYRDDLLDERVRFYTVILEYYQKDIFRVFEDDSATNAMALADLASEHKQVVESPLFGTEGLAPFPAYDPGEDDDRASLVHDNLQHRTVYEQLANGGYVFRTFDDPLADSNENLTADDPRIRAHRRLIEGDELRYEFLIDQYLGRIVEYERDSDRDSFPTHTVAQQIAQLAALDAAGLLTFDDDLVGGADPEAVGLYHDDITTQPMTDTDDTEQTREEKMDAFIESSPVLRSNTERRGSFLAGVAVGLLSKYQASPNGADVSRTVRDKYPVNRMTKRRLREAVTEVIDRNNVYSSREGNAIMYSSVLDRLTETLLEGDLDEWSLSKQEIRYYYAQGIAYGLTDQTDATIDEQADD